MIRNLRDVPIRSLELFALAISGQRWRILISTRSKHPLTVVLKSKTLVLDPDRTFLFDLALAANCGEADEWLGKLSGTTASQRNQQLTRQARQILIPAKQQWLMDRYRRLSNNWRNRYLPGQTLAGFHVTENQASWNSLRKGASAVGCKLEMIGGFELQGLERDSRSLVQAIRNGDIEWDVLHGLDEFAVATVPFSISNVHTQDMESVERYLNDSEVVQSMNSFYGCLQRKAESLEERLPRGELRAQGVHLDDSRLVAAIVSARRGTLARIFRSKSSNVQPNFDPSRQLVYMQLDWNDIASSDLEVQQGKRRWGVLQQVVLGYVRACVRLDVDLVMESFADQYFSWSHNANCPPHCIVQFRTSIKSIDQPADESFWSRLIDFLTQPPRLPGRPVSFQPLTCRHIARDLRSFSRTHEHTMRNLFWCSRPELDGRIARKSSARLEERMSEYIDTTMENLERDFPPGQFDSEATFLPNPIIEYGHREGFLKQTFNGKNG